MSEKVVNLFKPELTPDEILERAKGKLKDVVVLGLDDNEHLDVRSTNMTASQVAWICQTFLQKLYNGDYAE